MEGLTYNTQRDHLAIPAYGRFTQELVERALTLEGDRQQAFVERIVRMMYQQYGQQDDLSREDTERKLWQHVYRLSGFRLSALPPDGQRPTPGEDNVPPAEVPYPKPISKQRNYGQYAARLIERAVETQDPERRRAITRTVASYMKLAYSTYSNAQNISDKVILADLKKMSEGRLEVGDDLDLNAFMGQGSQSHIKQTAPASRRRKKKKGGNRNRKRYRKR